MKLTSQFPSTTTVHTTTLHTGLPVGEHGLYEWNLYEPRLERLITPLWFCFAGERERDTLLAAGLEAADVFPFPTLYQRLDVPCHVAQPDAYAFSTPNRRLCAGATVHAFDRAAEGLALLAGGARSRGARLRDDLPLRRSTALMHQHGPDAPGVDAAGRGDALRRSPQRRGPRGRSPPHRRPRHGGGLARAHELRQRRSGRSWPSTS